MTTVVWHTYHPTAPPKGYWSYAMLERLLAGLPQTDNIYNVDTNEPVIIVVPAEYNVNFVDRLNDDIRRFDNWVTVILASDENGFFPVEQLTSVNQLWVLMPHFEKHTYPDGTQFMGIGSPQHTYDNLSHLFYYEPSHDCSFSGQITHERRRELAEAMDATGWYINKTAGFTQGLSPDDYARLIAHTKVTPAPSGPVTFDSFRAYETLEAGNVPILDDRCPIDPDGPRFWNAILGEGHPLPHASNWVTDLVPEVQDVLDNWPTSRLLTYSWWQQHKRELRLRLLSPIPGYDPGLVTVLIPTSPVPSNPSLHIIEETIASVRHHLPNAEILILCDGVRPEQEHRRGDYEDFLQELCWKANFHYDRVTPIVFAGHEHQANMTRVGLDFVRTPFVLFVEHDTPLVTDEPIDWEGAYSLLTTEVDVVRFHHEALVHPEHEHMTLDAEIQYHGDFPYRRTVQWSQRPHLAGTNYYRRIIHDHFPPTGRTMIEDKMHSVAQSWPDEHRIAIYHPPTGNIKRSYHLDGRGDDPKYDMVYE